MDLGVMLGEVGTAAGRIATARALGATHYRPMAVYVDHPECPDYRRARNAGLSVVLTVRANGGNNRPTKYPGSLGHFAVELQQVLDEYRPAILVVENEEDSGIYYTGDADDYLAELGIACDVAHSLSIPVADGGIVGLCLAWLVVADYWDCGQEDMAIDFAARTVLPLGATAGRIRKSLDKQRGQLARGRALLRGFRVAGADLVNFHWYYEDPDALVQAFAYLHKETGGLPTMSNEMGQHAESADDLTAILSAAAALDISPVVWFAVAGLRTRGLVDDNGALLPTGVAFRELAGGVL